MRKVRVSAAIPTSTMADIAFLLIVFFLVTTSFTRDRGLEVTLPEYGAQTRVPSRNITRVEISAAGAILHDDMPVSLDLLRQRVERMTMQNPEVIVSIKTNPDARYEYFVDVVDAVKQAGNEMISIAEPDF